MRLRFGTADSVLLVAGFVGLVEQEAVRVILRLNPSGLISGICFALIIIGAGVTVGRNFKIGPVEIDLGDDKEEPPSTPQQESQP